MLRDKLKRVVVGGLKIFLSYTRNQDEFNAVSEFRKHVENELKNHNPDAVIFQDLAHIEGGQPWPERIKEEVVAAQVFVLLFSPAYLQRHWCRREYTCFKEKEEALGHTPPRVIPVLWVQPQRTRKVEGDAIAHEISLLQQVDWSELRHHDWEQPRLRAEAARLAANILVMAARSSEVGVPSLLIRAAAPVGSASSPVPHPDTVISKAALQVERFLERAEDTTDVDEKIRLYTQVIRINPNDAATYYKRGLARFRTGDLEAQLADFTEAIRHQPNFPDALAKRADVHLDLYERDRSEASLAYSFRDYSEAIALDPKHAKAFLNRGVLCEKMRNPEGALADYDAAISIDPCIGRAYYNRFLLRRAKGDERGASQDRISAARLGFNPRQDEEYFTDIFSPKRAWRFDS